MELCLSERSLETVRSAVGTSIPDDTPAAIRRCLDPYQHGGGDDVTGKYRLSLADVRWLRPRLTKSGMSVSELMEESTMELPAVQEPARDPVLEARCQKLRDQQANDSYNRMVRNIDSRRLQEPSLNIGKQLREVNAQLVEVGQMLFSVLAAFVFGYMAGAVLGGAVDTGKRILCGLAAALIVLVAEGYFLMRYLTTMDHPPPATLQELRLAANHRRLAGQKETRARLEKARETAAQITAANTAGSHGDVKKIQ